MRLFINHSNLIKWVAKLAVSLALVIFFFLKLDTALLRHYLGEFDSRMFFAAAGLVLGVTGIRAYRWTALLSGYGIRLGWKKSFNLIQVGNFCGQLLPMTVGGDMVRAWYGHREGLPLKAAIHTVLLDRWFGFASLLIIILIGFPALRQVFAQPPAASILAGAVSLAFLALFSMLALDHIAAYLPERRVLREIADFAAGARQFVVNMKLSLPVFLAGMAVHLLSIGAVKILADGVGANVSLYQMLLLMPPVLLMSTLPFSLAGWGVREGAMIYALAYAGTPQEQAFIISVMMGLVSLLVSVQGGLIMLRKLPASLATRPPHANTAAEEALHTTKTANGSGGA